MYSVLIPALNESSKIAQIIEESVKITHDVLVVDDGSEDCTSEIALSAGARVIRNPVTRGLGFSLHRGLMQLFNEGVETVVTIDGDGAHNPTQIKPLVEFHYKSKSDITIGSRLMIDEYSNSFPSPKRSANKLGAILFKHLCNINLSDVASGMRVINSKYTSLPRMSDNYQYTFDLLCQAKKHQFILNDFPIEVRYDASQFFATRIAEIIGLVEAVHPNLVNVQHSFKLSQFLDRIRNLEKFCLQVNEHLFHFFPIVQYDAYLVQEQHQIFIDIKDVNIIKFNFL